MKKKGLLVLITLMAFVMPVHLFAQDGGQSQMIQEESKFKVSGFINVETQTYIPVHKDSTLGSITGDDTVFNHNNLNLYF
ncbi:hypothetical protein ACFL20_09940 [Spirochaetota bacterium]